MSENEEFCKVTLNLAHDVTAWIEESELEGRIDEEEVELLARAVREMHYCVTRIKALDKDLAYHKDEGGPPDPLHRCPT